MRCLDVLVTGHFIPGAEKKLEKMFTNYDMVEIYTLGAPECGINPEASAFAFRHIHPLTLGTLEDADRILARMLASDNPAVLVCTNDEENDRHADANIKAALRMAKENPRIQLRRIHS